MIDTLFSIVILSVVIFYILVRILVVHFSTLLNAHEQVILKRLKRAYRAFK